jgi:hypothetical protein
VVGWALAHADLLDNCLCPPITQIFTDSREEGEGESEKEPSLTLAIVSPISLLPVLDAGVFL